VDGRRPAVVISGSFRKHYQGILDRIAAFEDAGVTVLSPRASRIVNPGEAFAILETDGAETPEALERSHLDAISAADALYVHNPEGYVGLSAALEVGWALSLGKEIFVAEPAADFTLGLFCQRVASPQQIAELLGGRTRLDALGPRASLDALQTYTAAVGEERGFADETPMEILVLACEELGELARAVRKYTGVKVDAARADRIPAVGEEIADVFIYMLHLANTMRINLFEVFRRKEAANAKRTWIRSTPG
jgi:NTP pyrophosphatase (non-canonical NTP hydrolase)